MAQKIHLLVIDPQEDFTNKNGSLSVPGADIGTDRIAAMIDRLGKKITNISVSLDSHYPMDVSHPMWWMDSAGNHPSPFTIISAQDMNDGKWTTTNRGRFNSSLKYLEALAAANRYPHCIWPYHCLIGQEGQSMHKNFASSLFEWSVKYRRNPNFISKGSNIGTEHFSAIKAEVPDPQDESTQINMPAVQTIEKADIILLAGWARSHCLANTGYDVRDNFSDPSYLRKIHLLTDGTGDVPTFEHLGEKFVTDMTAGGQGMQLTTTTDFLA